MFSLLFGELEPKLWVGCCKAARELVQFRHPTVDMNWDNWVSGFTIYLVVVMQAQLWRNPAMVKYFDMVHHAYNSFVGSVWLCYVEMFHMRAAMDPSVLWDKKNT